MYAGMKGIIFYSVRCDMLIAIKFADYKNIENYYN